MIYRQFVSMQPWARPWAGQGVFWVEASTAQTPTASVPFLGVNMLTILKDNFLSLFQMMSLRLKRVDFAQGHRYKIVLFSPKPSFASEPMPFAASVSLRVASIWWELQPVCTRLGPHQPPVREGEAHRVESS